jgi:hypothetical protein
MEIFDVKIPATTAARGATELAEMGVVGGARLVDASPMRATPDRRAARGDTGADRQGRTPLPTGNAATPRRTEGPRSIARASSLQTPPRRHFAQGPRASTCLTSWQGPDDRASPVYGLRYAHRPARAISRSNHRRRIRPQQTNARDRLDAELKNPEPAATRLVRSAERTLPIEPLAPEKGNVGIRRRSSSDIAGRTSGLVTRSTAMRNGGTSWSGLAGRHPCGDRPTSGE